MEIKEVLKFKTTDGQEFDSREDAYKWQSCLNVHDLNPKKISDKGWTQEIKDKWELSAFLNYLHFYLGFENVYDNYDELEYPVSIKYDLKDYKFEIKE